MEIGIVTDEISPDIREAITLGMSWGIQDFEFRTCKSGRIPFVSNADLETLAACKKEFGIRITALSPGTFKVPLEDEAAVRRDLEEILPRTIDLAEKFESPLVITFGFMKSADHSNAGFHRAVEMFRKAADLAERYGIRLALENEPGFWADTGENTAKLLAAVNSKHLGANWDPANALGAQKLPYPAGYQALRDWVVNLHVKDAEKDSTLACVPVGEGKIQWEDQLRAVVQDGRLRHVTIETHCLPLIEKSKQNVETVRRMLSNIEQELSREVKAS